MGYAIKDAQMGLAMSGLLQDAAHLVGLIPIESVCTQMKNADSLCMVIILKVVI